MSDVTVPSLFHHNFFYLKSYLKTNITPFQANGIKIGPQHSTAGGASGAGGAGAGGAAGGGCC